MAGALLSVRFALAFLVIRASSMAKRTPPVSRRWYLALRDCGNLLRQTVCLESCCTVSAKEAGGTVERACASGGKVAIVVLSPLVHRKGDRAQLVGRMDQTATAVVIS